MSIKRAITALAIVVIAFSIGAIVAVINMIGLGWQALAVIGGIGGGILLYQALGD